MCTFYRQTNKWKWLWYGKNAHRTRMSRRFLTRAKHKYIKLAWVWVEAISKPYRNAHNHIFMKMTKKINAETPAFEFVLYFFSALSYCCCCCVLCSSSELCLELKIAFDYFTCYHHFVTKSTRSFSEITKNALLYDTNAISYNYWKKEIWLEINFAGNKKKSTTKCPFNQCKNRNSTRKSCYQWNYMKLTFTKYLLIQLKKDGFFQVYLLEMS